MGFNQIIGQTLNQKNVFLLPQKKKKKPSEMAAHTHTHTRWLSKKSKLFTFIRANEIKPSALYTWLGSDLHSVIFLQTLKSWFLINTSDIWTFWGSLLFHGTNSINNLWAGMSFASRARFNKWTWSSTQDVAASPYWSIYLCLLFGKSVVHLYGKKKRIFQYLGEVMKWKDQYHSHVGGLST